MYNRARIPVVSGAERAQSFSDILYGPLRRLKVPFLVDPGAEHERRFKSVRPRRLSLDTRFDKWRNDQAIQDPRHLLNCHTSASLEPPSKDFHCCRHANDICELEGEPSTAR